MGAGATLVSREVLGRLRQEPGRREPRALGQRREDIHLALVPECLPVPSTAAPPGRALLTHHPLGSQSPLRCLSVRTPGMSASRGPTPSYCHQHTAAACQVGPPVNSEVTTTL